MEARELVEMAILRILLRYVFQISSIATLLFFLPFPEQFCYATNCADSGKETSVL